ncbi:CBS domain-containing protein [Nakamurella sp. UYEF19]|uniref:putative nucleotidyltransferase substrate binding domain-containing protein n=1 Tax=Nakamurella sp. UYEF19 TaxID=1756392 RepID=UPI003394648C
MDDLERFLGGHPPFDALPESDLHWIAAAALITDFTAGQRILDAFAAPSQEMFVVMSGQVELWNSDEAGTREADEVLGPGGVFGFSAMLSRSAVGPLAAALGPVRLARIPAEAVEPVFSSAAGLRFLARNLTAAVARPSSASTYGIVDQLIFTEPVLVAADTTVAQAARLMTERGSRWAVVDTGSGRYGLLTDGRLRAGIVAAGLPGDTRVSAVMLDPAPSVVTGTLAAQALLELTDRHLDALLVTDRAGALKGIVARDDFIVSPSTAGVSLREQVGRTATVEQLEVLARRMPLLLGDLLRRGRSAGEVTTIYSTVVDAVVRRALGLALDSLPDLDAAEVTWLSLGSNGRREPVPSSDIDAAVVFAESVDSPDREAPYRNAFQDVSTILTRCGLSIDPHGATPGVPMFARTGSSWRSAALEWMASPLEANGMMMTSLLLDARPVQGDPGLPVVNEVFGDMHGHPATLRLLLAESLSHRARLRSMRDVLARRGGTFDLKTHALRPVVDIARWAALAVGSKELSTGGRLTVAAGSPMLMQDQADSLVEVFEVLQKTRIRYQLAQIDRGEAPSDVLSMRRLSPLDRSLVGQAVREIASVQKRMANLSQVSSPGSWAG